MVTVPFCRVAGTLPLSVEVRNQQATPRLEHAAELRKDRARRRLREHALADDSVETHIGKRQFLQRGTEQRRLGRLFARREEQRAGAIDPHRRQPVGSVQVAHGCSRAASGIEQPASLLESAQFQQACRKFEPAGSQGIVSGLQQIATTIQGPGGHTLAGPNVLADVAAVFFIVRTPRPFTPAPAAHP